MRVYRLQTDRACPRACQGQDPGGGRVIGRLVTPEALGAAYAALGVDADTALSAEDVSAAVVARGAGISLAGGLRLRRARPLQADRPAAPRVPAGPEHGRAQTRGGGGQTVLTRVD